jgi:RecA/RadA recombinase
MAEKKDKKKKKKKASGSVLKREVRVTEWLSTGSTGLDMAISCNKDRYGGIPTRRIVEFHGTGASGKTYICGEIAGDAIYKGYTVYVDDIERRWDLDRLKTFGFEYDNKLFHYLDPSSTVEGCFERLFKIIDKHAGKNKLLYIVDPIAALYAIQEKKSDKMSQAKAKALQKHMRFLKDRVTGDKEAVVSIVFSNQMIDAVGVTMGPKKVTPGGNTMVHWPSVRVKFAFAGKITSKQQARKEEKDVIVGVKLTAEVVKNSEDDPFRTAVMSVLRGYGIDNIRDNAKWLKEYTDVLGESDGWYTMPTSKDGKKYKSKQGLSAFVDFVEKKGLERKLASLMRREYRKWHKPDERKPKVRNGS